MSSLAVNNGNNGQSSTISTWDNSQIDIIKNQIAKGCSDGELQLFSQVCQKTGLDPFSRQIYAISRGGKMVIQTSIDGFRTIAARSGLYGGSMTEWCDDNGVWRDVWLSSKSPAAAKTTVWRIGSPNPFTGVARYAAYQQGNSMWSKMGDVMIGKVSEALALRKAFPAELSGVYSSDEMEQSDPQPVNNSAPIAYSTNAIQYQADLRTAFEILGWDDTRKSGLAKTVSALPYLQWTDDLWQSMLAKVYTEINKLNGDISAVDAEVVANG